MYQEFQKIFRLLKLIFLQLRKITVRVLKSENYIRITYFFVYN